MKVDSIIFKEFLLRGYSLKHTKRVWNISNSKLWYLTPAQAQAYLNLENSAPYKHVMIESEFGLLQKHASQLARHVFNNVPLNVVDIGCGDGHKAVPLLASFSALTNIRYCPVDISGYMVSKAIARITKLGLGEVIQFKWNISDFDSLPIISSLIREKPFETSFFALLGNTINNFEFHEVMHEVSGALQTGEFLLIGSALRSNNIESIIAGYKSDLQDAFVSLILTQVGFAREDLVFDVRYRNSRFEGFYTLLCDTTLHVDDKMLHFKKGDEIIVAVSYLRNESELRKELSLYFPTVTFYVNDSKTNTLALCQK